MGRTPKNPALHALHGNPSRRTHAGNPDFADGELARMPSTLGKEGKKHWKHVVSELKKTNGLIKPTDWTILVLHCEAWQTYQDAKAAISDNGGMTTKTDKGNIIQHPLVGIMNQAYERVLKTGQALGMSPVARKKIELTVKKEEKENALSQLLDRRKNAASGD